MKSKSSKTQLPCGRKRAEAPLLPHVKTSEPDWLKTLNLYLKKEGLRSTSQREKIAEIAFSHQSHFDIQTLIKEIQKSHPEMSPATVYRSVSTLCEAGLLHETFKSDSGVTLYEIHDQTHHDHIVCLDCGEIFEFHDEEIEAAQTQAMKKMNFSESRHQHVVYAYCSYLKKN